MKSITHFVLMMSLTLPLIIVDTSSGQKSDEKQKKEKTVVYTRERGWLGVSVEDVTSKLARRKNLKVDEGVHVKEVEEDSPADAAGIKTGDVIVEFDGKEIYDNGDLVAEVRRTKPGTEVVIGIIREGETKSLKAAIARAPRTPQVYSFNGPSLPRVPIAPHVSIVHGFGLYGLSLEELNKQLGEYFNAPDGRGVLVKNVKRTSEAENAGFKAGDVIVKVGKETIVDVGDIRDALEEFQKGDKAEFEVLRKGVTQKLTLVVDEKPRRLSLREFDMNIDSGMDIDTEIEIVPPEEGVHFRHESNRLKHELERMKDSIHDHMIDLKNKLKHQLHRIRLSVNV